MSRDARDWAWRQALPPTAKLVLLALAERSNGDGVCWPSVHYLACATGLSDRTVQKALRCVAAMGLIQISTGGGRAANRYTLRVVATAASETGEPTEWCRTFTREPTPLAYDVHASSDTPPPDRCPASTAGVKGEHPNRNGTVTESVMQSNRAEKNAEPMVLPSWIDGDTWLAFLDHRRCIRAPMTEIAQQRAICALGRLRDQGQDPVEVLNQSIVNGWKGLFPVKVGSPGAPSTFEANARVLRGLFGGEDGQEDLPGGAGVPGRGVRHHAPARTDGRVLGPARRLAR